MPERHRPSVVGCALGFAAAGSGVGSLVGTALTRVFFADLPPGEGTVQEQVMANYGGLLWGIALGVLVGAVVGAVYAVRARCAATGRDASAER